MPHTIGQYLIPVQFSKLSPCFAPCDGVSVNNDIALVWLLPNSAGKQIGDVTGYFGWANNGWSFSTPVAGWGVPTAPASAQLTQFGYPGAFDSGTRMQISNSATYTMTTTTTNLVNMIR